MDKFLHALIKKLLVLLMCGTTLGVHAQILVQDFETLGSLSEFVSSTPSKWQVNAIREASPDNEASFSLYERPASGQTMLRLNRKGNERVYWLKETGATTPGVLKIQFKMMVNPFTTTAPDPVIAGFFIGRNFRNDAVYPDWVDRYASINLNWEGESRFSIKNISTQGGSASESFTTDGLSTITLIINSSAEEFSYVSPMGQEETLGSGKIDLWVNRNKAWDEANAVGAATDIGMQQVKFVSWGNEMTGDAFFDDLLIEAVPAYQAAPELDPAGGVYTVGAGGDFPSLTNPGGVFQALNDLGTISGPFTFKVISDLMEESGEVALSEIAGASAANTITFRPEQENLYTISGASPALALIRLNGADWVRFDGRMEGETGEGLEIDRYLLFRNAAPAPTFHFFNDATHNVLAYSSVQGASVVPTEGVVFLGDGLSTGNDANSFLYNRIGGYGQQTPLNGLTSFNTVSAALTEEVLLEGNQFYSFAASASLNASMFPCAVLAGQGNSQWIMRNNHLFQEQQSNPVVAVNGLFRFQGFCVAGGTDYLLEGNYIGGSAPFAAGAPLRVATAQSADNFGAYPSVIPFDIAVPDGRADIIGNTSTNVDITGDPFICNALAYGSVVNQGEVNFINNTFGDPSGASSITVRNNYSGTSNGGSFLVAPISYQLAGSGTVTKNFIGSVRLEGSTQVGLSNVDFRGIQNNPAATNSLISQNTIANITAEVSGSMGASMMGIYAQGLGDIEISRNVLYGFVNNAEVQALACSPTSIIEANVVGIVAENITGQTLVANNMITFEDVRPESSTTYYGILVPSISLDGTKVYFNSVFVHGGDNASAGSSYLFYRTQITPIEVFNNIFLNTRTTDNLNFVIGTRFTDNWSSGFNLFYQATGKPDRDDFGQYGPSNFVDNCEAWIALVESEGSICANVAADFIDPERGNLRIARQEDPSPVLDAGIVVAEVETDIDFALRIDPDIGASEGFNTWIGVVDTDWFKPGNWSAGTVPSCGGNPALLGYSRVSIAPTGTVIYGQVVEHQPVITFSPGPEGDAQADFRTLLIQEGASVTIGDPKARLRQCGGIDPLREGITNRGAIIYAQPGTISLAGFLENLGSFAPGQGTLLLNGDGLQNISSTEPLEVFNLGIEGGSNKVLLGDLLVLNAVDLVAGVVVSSAPASEAGTLILDFDAQFTDTSVPDNDTYVAGPLVKRINTTEAFDFPVGDENQLGRAAIIPESNAQAVFLVEYHFDSPPFPTALTDANAGVFRDDIVRVSDDEYWTILRLEGNTDVQVQLCWSDNSGLEQIEDKGTDLLVVRWNASIPAWVSEGNEGVVEALPPSLGCLLSAEAVSGFGVFTFGTADPNVPLPVELLNFEASLAVNDVVLDWQTATEKNSSYFNVQRSVDGEKFETIGQLPAAGNSQELISYAFTDKGIATVMAGVVYYRLEQVDIDGTPQLSPLARVVLPDESFAIKGAYPNPFSDELLVNINGSKDQHVQLRLLDVNGRQLLRQALKVSAGENAMSVLNVHSLQSGIYILEISTAAEVSQYKVVKK